MLPFLKVPVGPDVDFFELTRLRLTWNIHLLLILSLIPIISISFYSQPFYASYYAGALVLVMVSAVLIWRTGNFRIFSTCVSTILYVMIIFSMYRVDNYVHIIEPFWLLALVIYIYFIHGKLWGGLAIVGTVVSTVIFLFFQLNSTIENVAKMQALDSLSMGLEFTVCLSFIGYVLYQFIFLKNHAERELKAMNEALRKEKELVESRDKEKTILLQEIHHRVKNNLQIVMSLLRMQSTKTESPEAKVHLNDAINRVLTMSLIHQKLYESDNLSAIDLSEYIESLASDVVRSNQVPCEITQSFSIQIPNIRMKTIVPIALIVTELISNSVKHAFDNTPNPTINLEAKYLEDSDQIELKYADNGRWKEPTKESFGTQLIEALTEQLEGTFDLNTGPEGSSYTFRLQQLD